ncbi:hypothetical protein B0H21DRAFT_777101 [Amylocystis lapponica]|nr:hypothetical protein B0H21DRAFT_777101 [Amylocystis lapponica]
MTMLYMRPFDDTDLSTFGEVVDFISHWHQDGVHILSPLSRIHHPVRYYFIDFGISSQFERGKSPLVLGRKDRDKEVPELSLEIPYDASKVDIFIFGNLYKKELIQVLLGSLVRATTAPDPAQRPTAEGAFFMFEGIRLNTVSSLASTFSG